MAVNLLGEPLKLSLNMSRLDIQIESILVAGLLDESLVHSFIRERKGRLLVEVGGSHRNVLLLLDASTEGLSKYWESALDSVGAVYLKAINIDLISGNDLCSAISSAIDVCNPASIEVVIHSTRKSKAEWEVTMRYYRIRPHQVHIVQSPRLKTDTVNENTTHL